MTKTIINNNMTTFGEVENGTFFTDSENHFCYKVSENQILDFTLNEFFGSSDDDGCFYNYDDFVTVHKTVVIDVIA